ncbi:putative phytol kinase 2, chloroplastic [Cinnamomum micranthum f. kanehirae]|uniref:Putative phytol kinase 2, chloroplastic n=1 Tax=Cinnamomum micranthum f. kanehirae TaxID=337451 RepID=A0A3S3Q8G6_9MAGN|nr:putative phytol kinase 2, chloroplastic [Cinnamomum micranthum f. kanehirae]
MATQLYPFSNPIPSPHSRFSNPPNSSSQFRLSPPIRSAPLLPHRLRNSLFSFSFTPAGKRRILASLTASMLPENPFAYDVCIAAVASAFAFSMLRFWEEMAKRGVFDQKLNRKLVHISVGLAFMLFWPLFSSGRQAAFLASLAPGLNIIRMLLLGLGIWRNDAMVKSMSRHGDYRELLKGPLYYASTITLATLFFWRTSPVAISAICNLCAGDGFADIVGRRFGTQKLPYNSKKSVVGSFAMASAGFIASVGYMYYFSMFGFMEVSLRLIFGFLLVSLATAIVESLPISTELDDNLTVPLTSLVFGTLIL